MVHTIRIAAALFALYVYGAPATAQNVYRCGDSYSNQPCAGASVVMADDPRSAAQRAATEAATTRDAKSAAIMQKERVKQEGEPAQATIPAPRVEAPEPVREQAVARKKTRPRKSELFTAVAPKKAGDTATKKSKGRKPAKTGAA